MIPTHGQIRLVRRQLDKKFENPSPPRSPLGAIFATPVPTFLGYIGFYVVLSHQRSASTWHPFGRLPTIVDLIPALFLHSGIRI